jgi:hypothetical protein
MSGEYNAGSFKGKVVDYGFRTTNAGNLNIAVLFEYEQSLGDRKRLTWWGYLNEGKAREITLKTLKLLGWKGQAIEGLNSGVSSGILDTDTEFSIVVDLEEYQGVTRPKIKWVNAGGGFQERLDLSEVKQKLGGMNLKADVIELFGHSPQVDTPPSFTHDQNIPF